MKSGRNQKLLKSFGDRLAELRHSKGLSVRKLGIQAEVDPSMIHRIEKGQTSPSLIILAAIAEALNITLTELVDF